MARKRIDEAALAQAIERSTQLLRQTQDADGSWPGDYGGPMFLLPLFVATAHIVGEPLEPTEVAEMRRYIRGKQNRDGGFGLHVEGDSTVYGTCSNYVALRLLGDSADDEAVRRAREWIHAHGGPTHSASWGKFFLCLLGLYSYEGINPVPPELWLLPESAPVHPSKLWCHCRMVYLPMSYLYGARARAEESPLLGEIRSELYPEPFDSVDWLWSRRQIAKADNLVPQSRLARAANRALGALEKRWSAGYRKRALAFVLHQIEREDQNTNYICIGPINKLLNTLVWHFEDPTGPELQRHRPRMRDYLYQAKDGMKMQGYNSSRLWDTTFAVQALLASGGDSRAADVLSQAHRYIDENQVRTDVRDPESAYRHPSKGGWPFSDQPHGWPISDCTAEGLKCCLALEHRVEAPLPPDRLTEAMELILSLQNSDGGWATYEQQRGPSWLELLNPAECFRDIMVDYSYVECTSACIQALVEYRDRFDASCPDSLHHAIRAGKDFLLREQRSDGSFEGSWGVCFTYGTWFGVSGLLAAGVPLDHKAIRKARAFLESKQRSDGGWGESVQNCLTRTYDDTTPSQVVMTSWALLSLIACGAANGTPVEQGLRFLLSKQRTDGSFPDENIAGVFNKTCAIHYDNYLKVFPLWAFGAYRTARVSKS